MSWRDPQKLRSASTKRPCWPGSSALPHSSLSITVLPPITGRILGWLMICDPPEQSPAQISEAINASRASLTTNMRFLIASGLVHRLTRSGGRTAYYRIDDDMWEKVIQRRIASMMSFGKIAQDGVSLLGAGNPRARRVRAAHDFFKWMAKLLASSPGPSPAKPRGG